MSDDEFPGEPSGARGLASDDSRDTSGIPVDTADGALAKTTQSRRLDFPVAAPPRVLEKTVSCQLIKYEAASSASSTIDFS